MSDLHKLVRDQCANLGKRGRCVFSGKPCSVLEDQACHMQYVACMGKKGTGGSYFEVAVLPLAGREPGYENAVKEYEAITKARTGVKVSLCQCGNSRQPGHQWCEECKKKQRKLAQRKYKERNEYNKS